MKRIHNVGLALPNVCINDTQPEHLDFCRVAVIKSGKATPIAWETVIGRRERLSRPNPIIVENWLDSTCGLDSSGRRPDVQ
jgi:hypothetical protein